MNNIESLECVHLRSDKTIEEIVLSDGQKSNRLFVFNDQGKHYKVFGNLPDLLYYFVQLNDNVILFETDDDESLDRFLEYDYKVS